MADPLTRQALAGILWQQFPEKKHICSELHARAWLLLAQEKFDDAMRCCDESYRLGLGMGDSYIRAASRLYSGLILFALKDPVHWDRAQDYCEESAALFHAVGERSAESNAWWTVAQIADTHTAAGYDRAQRALAAYLHVLSPDADTPEALETLARTAYGAAVNRIGAADGKPPPQPPPPKQEPSAPPPESKREPEPEPEAPPGPIRVPPPVVRFPAGAPTGTRTVSRLELVTLAILIVDGIVVLGLAGWLLWDLLGTRPELRVLIVVLGGVLLAATLVPLSILAGTGRLVFAVHARQAAVLRSRGKLLADERVGWHVALPAVEALDAILPVARRRLSGRLFDIQCADGYSFLARVHVVYRITNAAQAWSQLLTRVYRTRVLGLDEVFGAQLSAQASDEWVQTLVSEALHQLASIPAHRPVLQAGDALNQTVLEQLQGQTLSSGLQFYQVQIFPYHRTP